MFEFLYSQISSPAGIEAIGLLALVTVVLAYQSNVRKTIIVLQSSGMALMTVHLLLLAAPTGAVMLIASIARNILFYFKERYVWIGSPVTIVCMIMLMLALGLAAWEGFVSVFAITGTIVGTYAIWLTEPRAIRLFTIFAILPWIPYGIINNSISILLLQAFLLVSVGSAIWRFDIRSSLDVE